MSKIAAVNFDAPEPNVLETAVSPLAVGWNAADGEPIQQREGFDRLLAAWRREIMDYSSPDTDNTRIRQIENGNRDLELAALIMAYPIPYDWQIGLKLEVLAHYAVLGGAGALPGVRLVNQAVHLLRADVAQLIDA
ncbi:hypothetical protein [Methylopila sp. 73B]|uniref:hypothetical protein n=1 Tax=Methylopila sp. 73B TaxID=1120792 RepID=UPI00036E2FB9|nr:hypothetical protein [Methylopila sp. 73B]